MWVDGNAPILPHQNMSKTSSPPSVTALWLSDLHLDKADNTQRQALLRQIRTTESDHLLITGDISNAMNLHRDLSDLAKAAAPRNVYVVTGNHDYHGGSIAQVDARLGKFCASVANLHHVDGRRIFPLGRCVCVLGHGGWPDARAGYGLDTVVDFPDRHVIREFQSLDQKESLQAMRRLGLQSAQAIRKLLPLALSMYRHVIVLAHCPPFPSAARYRHKACGPTHSPHFVNLSAGLVIRKIADAFPHRRVTVLCGHTHHAHEARISPNVVVRVSGGMARQSLERSILAF